MRLVFGTIGEVLNWLLRVFYSACSKFWWDDCFSRASSLAYTSLFALVPGSALIFGLFSGFNIDSEFVDSKFGGLLAQLLPPDEDKLLGNLKDQLVVYLKQLAEVVRALGIVSLPVLIITGITLVNSIESALNVVWRVSSRLSYFSKFVNFWAVITLGPLLVALSFYWYAKFTTMSYLDTNWSPGLFALIDVFVPIFFIFTALTLLFYKLPAARVALSDAMLGAFFAATIFEALKRGFAFYISISTAYQSFYGVLVTLPLFLFWLYLAWVVVLFGAQVTYQAGSISVLSGLKKYASELGEIGGLLGLRILLVIGVRFAKGNSLPTESEIAVETGSDPVLVRTCLSILADAGMITQSDPDTHVRGLMISPDRLTLQEVAMAFRSKQYRNKIASKGNETPSGELDFLETLRYTSRYVDAKIEVKNWKLADLILASNRS